MAKIKCKGTVLQQEIASVFTAVAQIISLDGPEAETETFESDTLDNADAGIPYDPTGRTEGGEVTGEMFFDPALAGHQALTDLLLAPAKTAFKLIFADAATTEWPFDAAGLSLGVAVDLSDGLKASFGLKVDKTVTYPS
ncbi:MAG: hypothetical protein AAFZ07_20205 [Actinomycetota bacterium]